MQAAWLGLLLALVLSPPFERAKVVDHLENVALDLRFALRGPVEPGPGEPRILLVAVDDRSLFPELSPDEKKDPWLARLEDSWPWDRTLHGEVLTRLLADGARVVAFDFVFPGPNEGDLAFFDAIEAAGDRVVLGFDYVPIQTGLGEVAMQERLPYDDLLPVDEGGLVGFTNVEIDEDGAVRRIRLGTNQARMALRLASTASEREKLHLLGERQKLRPSLAALAAARFTGEPALAAHGESDPWRIINYAGPSGWFPRVSYSDLLFDDRRAAIRPLVGDALVILAPWSDYFKDVRPTPLGPMYGAEIHAHTARNLILGDRFLRAPGPAVAAALPAGLALLLGLGLHRLRGAGWKVFLVAGTSLVFLVAAQAAFNGGRWILPVAGPLLICLAGGGGILLHEFIIEQVERRRVRGFLSRYVSADLARVLLEDRAGFDRLMTGETRTVTTLFSDIRGFTALSESRSPRELTTDLNLYFEAMAECVFGNRGSLNKYIGDAILAVWGDIVTAGPDTDATNAVRCALAMREALIGVNERLLAAGRAEGLRIGVGLHHGEAFLGNLGHPRRMEVAVMGETVNLASRIEGANKYYGTDTLVSAAVAERTKSAFRFVPVDRVRLAGTGGPVDLFLPVGGADEPAPPWVEAWVAAVETYRRHDFARALDLFAEPPGQGFPAPPLQDIYLARCREALKNPPPRDGDLFHTLDAK